ncbi:tRNA (adenosine(37)-N6)-threonylcarbamoyltransferase complex dimerization subunit type 1 TsaB [Gilvimarinus sp. F26214L]|uniref:tRNA (adenosine(37)-N6)-threonylcarbamoyltransferase complex dimerization subunit type 1 TsaB n=1 Tax=Gilvimarinus sp. DZF01 TaxID=3461371 RepID=UPI0040467350
MTKILALDTSTSACSVALNVDGRIEEEFTVAPQDHTQRLLPMVDGLLAAHEIGLSQLDAIAFTQGPGSFTGLRICVGVVQGLAFGANLPVIPVSSLKTLAAGAAERVDPRQGAVFVPVFDARMQEVYWGVYESISESGELQCRVADRVGSPDEVLEALSDYAASCAVHVLGSGCPLIAPEHVAANTAEAGNVQYHSDAHPHARDLARLAQPLLRSGQVVSALEAQPAYVRNEVTWAKRQRIRSK